MDIGTSGLYVSLALYLTLGLIGLFTLIQLYLFYGFNLTLPCHLDIGTSEQMGQIEQKL